MIIFLFTLYVVGWIMLFTTIKYNSDSIKNLTGYKLLYFCLLAFMIPMLGLIIFLHDFLKKPIF